MIQKLWVIIPAAGVGSRMQADRPKQYLSLLGKSVIEHTLSRFVDHPMVAAIVVAVSETDPYWPELVLPPTKPIYRAKGGDERCHSVLNGLESLSELAAEEDWVMVHDAARPCLLHRDIDRLIECLKDDDVGGILATPVRDTMKRDNGAGRIAHTEERVGLWHALTPQMFRYAVLRDSLQQALSEGFEVTDEASALEHVGLQPRLIEGSVSNIKITRPEDLQLAAFFLQHQEEKSE